MYYRFCCKTCNQRPRPRRKPGLRTHSSSSRRRAALRDPGGCALRQGGQAGGCQSARGRRAVGGGVPEAGGRGAVSVWGGAADLRVPSPIPRAAVAAAARAVVPRICMGISAGRHIWLLNSTPETCGHLLARCWLTRARMASSHGRLRRPRSARARLCKKRTSNFSELIN